MIASAPFKISKTTRNLAANLCLSIWRLEGGLIEIRDGSGEPEPGIANTPWILLKETAEEGLMWNGQLGGTCLKKHQLNQIKLHYRDEKALRQLLKLVHGFAMGYG